MEESGGCLNQLALAPHVFFVSCGVMGWGNGMEWIFFFETFEFLLLCYSALPSIGPIVSCSSESFSGLGKQVEEIMPCEVCSIRRG